MSAVKYAGVFLRLRRFRGCAAGVAMIEFAALAPLMVLMALGTFEITRAIVVHKRFQRAAAMVGDLVARETSLAPAQLAGIMRSAEQVMAPYSITPLKIGVMQVLATSSSNSTVQWNYSYNSGTTTSCGGSKAQPTSGMILNSSYAVMVEAEYQYTPALTGILPYSWSSKPLKEVVVNAPRDDVCVKYKVGTAAAACKAC